METLDDVVTLLRATPPEIRGALLEVIVADFVQMMERVRPNLSRAEVDDIAARVLAALRDAATAEGSGDGGRGEDAE